jgi:hypothetical protein
VSETADSGRAGGWRPYRRVEVRVQASGLPQLDYEIDERMYGGRWVVVDQGALGHPTADDCQRGGGS